MFVEDLCSGKRPCRWAETGSAAVRRFAPRPLIATELRSRDPAEADKISYILRAES